MKEIFEKLQKLSGYKLKFIYEKITNEFTIDLDSCEENEYEIFDYEHKINTAIEILESYNYKIKYEIFPHTVYNNEVRVSRLIKFYKGEVDF